jgi:hypothetical protein
MDPWADYRKIWVTDFLVYDTPRRLDRVAVHQSEVDTAALLVFDYPTPESCEGGPRPSGARHHPT